MIVTKDSTDKQTKTSARVPELTLPEMPLFAKEITSELKKVKKIIRQKNNSFVPNIQDYAEYILQSPGKYLRAGILLMTGECFGKITENHRKIAAVLEMIHLATLVHDDVIDHGEIRRNSKTANSKWGNKFAVLLGDTIFTQALSDTIALEDNFISNEICQTCKNVCQGEVLQSIKKNNSEINQSEYYDMIRLKTSSLFATATKLGAYMTNATKEDCLAMQKAGEKIGIAYQIYDDCVDIIGLQKDFGKTLGTDLKKGKITLPLILISARSNNSQMQELKKILNYTNKNISHIYNNGNSLSGKNENHKNHKNAFETGLSDAITIGTNLLQEAFRTIHKINIKTAAKRNLQHFEQNLTELFQNLLPK